MIYVFQDRINSLKYKYGGPSIPGEIHSCGKWLILLSVDGSLIIDVMQKALQKYIRCFICPSLESRKRLAHSLFFCIIYSLPLSSYSDLIHKKIIHCFELDN